MSNIVVGADIGGSHITCALYDTDRKTFKNIKRFRRTVNSQDSGQMILDSWAECITQAIEDAVDNGVAGIGFAMPGPFDYPNGISLIKGVHKFEDLYGVNIGEEVRKKLTLPDEFPVRFLNDAACFAIGESFREPALQYERLLAITLGTGFGTTFIEKHLPVAGRFGIPNDGFLYHIPLENATADDHFSTRWFVQQWKETTGENIDGVKQLVQKAEKMPQAKALFHTFGEKLGTFLAPWLSGFRADCLVLGGNISAAYPLFENPLMNAFKSSGLQINVVLSANSEDASITGAAMLCNNTFYQTLIPS
ncbi:MAG: ROK family protein [Bacteroidetes bacterium]|nr:MAG: ROK family protein [Bacteroidota bacterium]